MQGLVNFPLCCLCEVSIDEEQLEGHVQVLFGWKEASERIAMFLHKGPLTSLVHKDIIVRRYAVN